MPLFPILSDLKNAKVNNSWVVILLPDGVRDIRFTFLLKTTKKAGNMKHGCQLTGI